MEPTRETTSGYRQYEHDQYGSADIHPINRLCCKIRYISTFGWCKCSPIAVLNVRRFQIVLISLMLSAVAMFSNLRIIALMVEKVYSDEGFDWDRSQQVLAHTIFFYGNIFSNFFGHLVTKYMDNKAILCACLLFTCLINLITPFLIRRWNLLALLVTRFIIGILIGFLTELLHIVITRWSTRVEKMRMFCLALSGMNLGHALMLIIVTNFYDKRNPWGDDFYFMAAYGTVITFIWMIFGAKDPSLCPYLSVKERQYINENPVTTDVLEINFFNVPWKMILTNIPFYAMVAAELCYRMVFWITVAHMPLFFAEVYDYPFWKAGLMSALPHLLVWVSCYPVSQMIGLFIRARIVHPTACRKWCDLLALCVGSVSFYAMCGSTSLLGSVTSYTAAVTLEMYHLMGAGINHIDLSPRYCCLLFCIAKAFSNLMAILAAYLVMWLVPHMHIQQNWDSVFYVTGSVSMVGGLIYVAFGNAEIQDFNFHPP
ncbi:hypothetical protein GE061_017353 [Apolygus lucorum]|uniref:Major facilitator superfamily (MFS) profile domain-containing protein n=1 Tax=Apolygus lucorum TaxID=248454 RepID=A0A8S9XCY6_APOLU|nr:hypothetical protein GE061_017353 [Apolygus lucorum]